MNRKGIAVVVALIGMTVILMLSLAMVQSALGNLKTGSDLLNRAQARQRAEAGVDHALAYLDGKTPSVADLKRCIRKGTIALKLFPVVCGTAFKNKGVQPMLDAVIDYLPSPLDIPATVAKQTWRGNTLSHSTVITPEAAWPSIHMVEVVRSCPELCRFCLASYLTLPFRTPSLDDGLIPAVEKGLAATQRLGLLGASVTQHPQFADLLAWLDQDRFEGTRVSVSSVRAATVTAELGRILAKRGSKSLTIAIESGSERMRQVVNKKLATEEIYAAARYAKEGGLTGLKLYGMVGLPTEEDADVEATAELLLALKKATPGLRLTLGVSSFVPKAHTPFQWQGVRPEADKRLKLLAKRLKPKGIELRPESYGWSVIQALLSRSDRRLAPVIAAARGSHESLGGWKRAYRAALARDTSESSGSDTPQTTTTLLPNPPPWEQVVQIGRAHV